MSEALGPSGHGRPSGGSLGRSQRTHHLAAERRGHRRCGPFDRGDPARIGSRRVGSWSPRHPAYRAAPVATPTDDRSACAPRPTPGPPPGDAQRARLATTLVDADLSERDSSEAHAAEGRSPEEARSEADRTADAATRPEHPRPRPHRSAGRRPDASASSGRLDPGHARRRRLGDEPRSGIRPAPAGPGDARRRRARGRPADTGRTGAPRRTPPRVAQPAPARVRRNRAWLRDLTGPARPVAPPSERVSRSSGGAVAPRAPERCRAPGETSTWFAPRSARPPTPG